MRRLIGRMVLAAREGWLTWRLERARIAIGLERAQAEIELMEARLHGA